MSFYVIKCKNCGFWQVKEIRIEKKKSIFKCQSCGKSSKFITRSKSGPFALINYGPFEAPAMATVVCQKAKLHEQTKSDKIWNIDLEFNTPSTNTY